ncbi:MAG: NAD-dependent epimerase/dehydratase family protein [Vulcanimicrobiota bacterium]
MKKVLITGGAGFVGGALGSLLTGKGYKVRVFDNFFRGTRLEETEQREVIEGDVLDLPAVERAVEGCCMVVHCAAIAGIDTVLKSPSSTLRVNLVGASNVLEASRRAGTIERVLNFSTSEVFGNTAFGASEEDNAVTGSAGEARWCYAVSKLAGEHLAQAYWKEHRLGTVTVRPFNVYGPGQVGEGALQIFIKRALRDQDLTIYGEGNQIRAWCYIDDFVRALELVLESPDALGESFNIGNARAVVTIYGLANTVIRVLNSKSKIVFEPRRSADIELRVPSVEKARRMLSFEAKVDLEEGIQRTAEYYSKLLSS